MATETSLSSAKAINNLKGKEPSAVNALALATEAQSQLQDISEKDVVGVVLPLLYVKDDLSLMAERIRTTVIAMIKPNDLPTRVYRFRIDKFCSVYGLNSEKIYDSLRKALVQLREGFELPIEKGTGTGWILNWKITDAEVQVLLDKIIQDFYKEQVVRKFRLENIKDFVYSVTFKFYKMFIVELGENKETTFTIDIEELKDKVSSKTRYEKYSDFKRRVLDPAIYNINGEKLNARSKINDKTNMCDIKVEYEEIKEKRSVIGITFHIKRIKDSVESQLVLDPLYESLSEEGQQSYTLLRDTISASKSSIVFCINKYGEDTMNKIAKMVMLKLADPHCNIKNPGAYAGQCLRNGDVFGEGIAQGSDIIDAEVVDEEREKLCQELLDLGLAENYVIKTNKNKRISTRRIKAAIAKFYEKTKLGEDLTAGWIRRCIDTDFLFIDTPDPIKEAKKKQEEERIKAMSPEEFAKFTKKQAEIEQAKLMFEQSQGMPTIEVVAEEAPNKNNQEDAFLKIAVDNFVRNLDLEEELKIKEAIFSSLSDFQLASLARRAYYPDMCLEDLIKDKAIIYPKLVALYKAKQAEQ